MFDSIFRRFSLRRQMLHSENEKRKYLKNYYPCLPLLTPPLVVTIIEKMSFFEQLRMQAVCKHLHAYIQHKLRMIRKLDVRKQDITEATSSGTNWEIHPVGFLALRFTEDTAYMVIDEKWNSADLNILLNCMNVFHEWVEEVTLDAPIAELVVVSLSKLQLSQWYMFQCIMKLLDNYEDTYDRHTEFIAERETYWPRVQELTIRTKAWQASYLGRCMDYGVKSGFIIDRQVLSKLRIIFEDLDAIPTGPVRRNIYHFRCWIGSLAWDHRYEPVYLGSKNEDREEEEGENKENE